MSGSTLHASAPPPEFVAMVKDALENLYDPRYLQNHALRRLLLSGDPANMNRPLALRHALLDAIDKLKPHHLLSVGARQRRLYQILELRYVEALPFRKVMEQLALSQAQYHREQRHALEALATLIWEAVKGQEAQEPTKNGSVQEHRDLHAEIEAATHSTDVAVDLNAIAQSVADLLHETAGAHSVNLEQELAEIPIVVHGSRTGIRHLVITLAGYLLRSARGGQLRIHVDEAGKNAAFRLVYTCGDAAVADTSHMPRSDERLEVARQLLQPLGGALSIEESPERAVITVSLPRHTCSLLVIDDNPDIVHLVRRLVAPRQYVVLGANSVRDGLEMARNTKPDVILLDLMLPEQDGWDALQALKHNPVTQNIPVLVCSILDEGELAHSLGAVEFIRKPLTRQGLLDALSRWLAPKIHSGAGNQGSSESPARVG